MENEFLPIHVERIREFPSITQRGIIESQSIKTPCHESLSPSPPHHRNVSHPSYQKCTLLFFRAFFFFSSSLLLLLLPPKKPLTLAAAGPA